MSNFDFLFSDKFHSYSRFAICEKTDDGLAYEIDIPGKSKKDVSVSIEGNIIIVDTGDESIKIQVEPRSDKDSITARVKNGQLKIFVKDKENYKREITVE